MANLHTELVMGEPEQIMTMSLTEAIAQMHDTHNQLDPLDVPPLYVNATTTAATALTQQQFFPQLGGVGGGGGSSSGGGSGSGGRGGGGGSGGGGGGPPGGNPPAAAAAPAVAQQNGGLRGSPPFIFDGNRNRMEAWEQKFRLYHMAN